MITIIKMLIKEKKRKFDQNSILTKFSQFFKKSKNHIMAHPRLWIFFWRFHTDNNIIQPKNEYSGASFWDSMGISVKGLFGPFLTFLGPLIGQFSHIKYQKWYFTSQKTQSLSFWRIFAPTEDFFWKTCFWRIFKMPYISF